MYIVRIFTPIFNYIISLNPESNLPLPDTITPDMFEKFYKSLSTPTTAPVLKRKIWTAPTHNVKIELNGGTQLQLNQIYLKYPMLLISFFMSFLFAT